MRLVKALGIVIAVYVLLKMFVFIDYRHRFRLTIEFNTPDGVKSASAVHEVVRVNPIIIPLLPGDRVFYRLNAEAIFLDLGHGKNVVALLAGGRLARAVNLFQTMGIQAYAGVDHRHANEAWSGHYAPLKGSVPLPEYLTPTMITFANLADPRTARIVVYSTSSRSKGVLNGAIFDESRELLGPGYAFRRATIEKVATGIWPLNALGIYGEPVSEQLLNRLPWWNQPGRPANVAVRAMWRGENTGSSYGPETLFVWR